MAQIQANVTFTNNTGSTLTFVKKSCEHGVFLGTPPLRIANGESGRWECGSDGIMTGTEGRIEYVDDSKRTFHLHWDNPFVGSTKASCYLSPDDGTLTLDSHAGASSSGQARFTFMAARK